MAMDRFGIRCKVYLVSVLCVLQPLFVHSQERGTADDVVLRIIGLLEEELADSEDGSGGIEDMAICLEQLRDNPVAINRAGRGELQRLVLLSDFQIESILDYRATNGNICSAAELSLLYGFDKANVELLAPFITFVADGNILRNREHAVELYARASGDIVEDTSLIGSPHALLLKCRYQYGKNIAAGFSLQNDMGEYLFRKGYKFMDFYSGYLAVNDCKWLKSLVVGDFSARFGQGLVLWNSFSLNSAVSPEYLSKRGSGIAPYTSSDENNFFRGVAASCSFGKMEVSAMLSYNGVDARVKEGYYTSLPEDGLHNTTERLACRKTMREMVAGVDFSCLFPKLKVGFTASAYGYNKRNGRKIREDNKFRMYDGMWGNIAVNFNMFARRTRIFGEMAFDYGGSGAFLAGAVSPIFHNCNVGVLFRHYSKGYIAPHASACSTLSEVANQDGITVSASCSFSNFLKLNLNSDIVYYPWKRYNINEGTFQIKGSAALDYAGCRWNWSVKLSERYTSHNAGHRACIKGKVGYRPFSVLLVKGTGSMVYSGTLGYMAGVDLKYGSENGNIVLQGGGSYFNCREWSARLYNYEPDMPYTYNNRLLYGEGGCFYILLKYKISDGLECCLKGDTVRYIVSDRQTAAEKNPSAKVKMAVKYSF